MRSSLLIISLLPVGIVLAMAAASPQQALDTISYRGRHLTIIERPLDTFLRRSPKTPRFDIQSAANWQPYTASWEMRDSKLYLTAFRATINDQPVDAFFLFPDRKLPVHADWFSGTLHIPKRPAMAHESWTFTSATTLEVTNGLVTATNQLRAPAAGAQKR